MEILTLLPDREKHPWTSFFIMWDLERFSRHEFKLRSGRYLTKYDEKYDAIFYRQPLPTGFSIYQTEAFSRLKDKTIVNCGSGAQYESIKPIINQPPYVLFQHQGILKGDELPENGVILPPGIDLKKFPLKPDYDHEFKAIWVGNTNDPRHRIGELQRNMPPKTKLELVDGWLETPTPQISHDRIYLAYHEASVFASVADRDRGALPIPEAMCCGLPIVTLKSCGWVDYGILRDGENAILVDDYKGVREGVQYFKDNPSEIEKFGKRGRRMIEEKLDWRKIAPLYDEIFEEVRE